MAEHPCWSLHYYRLWDRRTDKGCSLKSIWL